MFSGVRVNPWTRPRLERISLPKEMTSKLERQDSNMYEEEHTLVDASKGKLATELSRVKAHEQPVRGGAQKSTEQPMSHEKSTGKQERTISAEYDDEGLAHLKWSARDRSELEEPAECREWRLVARDPRKLILYRDHFVSHDFMDWFVYAAFFTEQWHTKQSRKRPVYLDVAANHARRWSGTYFLDRCMGWDGVCVEANEKYWKELHAERHCKVVEKCVSDIERTVNFSLTDAYGGVVLGDGIGGVNGSLHEKDSKYKGQFRGIKQMKCSTLGKEVGVKHVHFWSLDVEGHELEVLRGFDWSKTRVDVIVTENRGKEVGAILSERGYEKVNKVLKDDIWIRNGSGFEVSERMRQLMRSFDKSSYRFLGA
ncbi:hypothetical protein FGB62_139g214 [Gracilaria domingensis]|nr:hypothetical protein FGB62_139g214 [Gracilaria domingensis]